MKRIYLSLFLTLSISLMKAALPTPILVSPINAATNQDSDVLLDWSPVTGANAYEYRIAANPAMNNYQNGSVSGSSQVNTFNLLFGTTWYWQVRAVKTTAPVDSSDWSVIRSFTTLDQLAQLSPLNQTTGATPEILLDWGGISGVTAYDYQWDTSAAFNSPISYYGSISGSAAYTFQLRFGAKYYWRVRARHAADTTQWSAVWNFSTLDQIIPLSPLIGSSGNDPEVLLDWSGITGITAYDYQWDTSAAFNSPVSYYGSITGSAAYTFQLRFGAKYYWRVRARHATDTTQWSAVWNFSTLDQIIPLSPLIGSSGNNPEVLLDWSGITGITAYDYQWDTSAAFNSPVSYYGSITGSAAYTFQLQFGAKYYWRVRARHGTDTTQWSAVLNFSTIAFPVQLSPINGAINLSLNPTIDWAGISGVTAYQYRFSTNADFGNGSPAITGISSQANLINLLYGTGYFWQVRACHAADTSSWSPAWLFTTLYQISSAPLLLSPANAALNISFSGTSLEWATVATATFYQYQLDEEQSFSTPLSGTESGSTAITGDLLPSTTYFWRVRAGNGSGNSAWSEIRSFTTETATETMKTISGEVLTIFPNPSDGLVQLSIGGKSFKENCTAALFSFDGKLIKEFEIEPSSSRLDLRNFQKGIYLIRISGDNKVESKKLIIR